MPVGGECSFHGVGGGPGRFLVAAVQVQNSLATAAGRKVVAAVQDDAVAGVLTFAASVMTR